MTNKKPKAAWPFGPEDTVEPSSQEIEAKKQAEQEKLIKVLKFTPCTYKVSLWGYGGEKVMGKVEREVWDYCMENQVDLQDIAWNSDACEEMNLDQEKLPFSPGSWYECDSMGHISGVSMDAGTVLVEDEKGNTVYENSLDQVDGSSDGPSLCCNDEIWVGMAAKDEIVFIGSSNEKGTFFEGEINLQAPFDIELLELHYDEFDGESIINSVYYDGEEIENYGGSTDGKSSDMTMCLLTDDEGTWERYEPGEKDWGHPEMGPSPSDWEASPEYKFKKQKPTEIGYYKAVWKNFGTSYGTLYWNGTEFGEWEYGQFNPIKNVETWQGYNWDTSSWVNQPPAPPDVICSNKKCGWIGNSEDRRRDDDYNDHCPQCDGTDFEWIDYDPNSKEGRANRKKYCKEWDPALALERISVPQEFTVQDRIAELEKAVLELGEKVGADPEELKSLKEPAAWPFSKTFKDL